MFRLPRKLKKQWKKAYGGMFYQTWRRMTIYKSFGKKYQKELEKNVQFIASVRDTGEPIQGTYGRTIKI